MPTANEEINMITQEELKRVLHYDHKTGIFTNLIKRSNNAKAGAFAGHRAARYIYINLNGKLYLAHRLAWLYIYGIWPDHHIDHIDGNCLNNAISNLRDVTQSVNCRNQKLRATNTSGHPGVHWYKATGKWTANISINGKSVHIGTFATFEEAVQSRRKASQENGFIHRQVGNS
ncbi:HNH endonuclease [Nitrosomonas sp. Is35]|uniref:HNH endonuclease n=1 Tax=Nitrosomonas sp. Is35 TaxID=3080534 RepID=UPI00294AF233|nr:HNH endonuclease [Nitrosomonas sp. Is35]MDV6347485.1 HNH endonuclease [Nitrosomonas sp. Is35]